MSYITDDYTSHNGYLFLAALRCCCSYFLADAVVVFAAAVVVDVFVVAATSVVAAVSQAGSPTAVLVTAFLTSSDAFGMIYNA